MNYDEKKPIHNNDKEMSDNHLKVNKKFNIKNLFKKIINEILYLFSRIDI